MTPKEFKDLIMGKSIDTDNYPPRQKYQCVDVFVYLLQVLNIPVNYVCALSGYACDLWKLRYQYGYQTYFDFITDVSQLRNGDICFWDAGSSHEYSHVAMYYDGKEVGQNQPYPYVTEKDTTWDIMGALRPKLWTQPARGYAECFDPNQAGAYLTTAPLHLRTGGEQSYYSLCIMPKKALVRCYGYYHIGKDNRKWLYVTYRDMVGFACADYLR